MAGLSRIALVLTLMVWLVPRPNSLIAVAHPPLNQAQASPVGCDPEWWQQIIRQLTPEQTDRYQAAFDRLGFGGSVLSFLNGEITSCGDFYIQAHHLRVSLPALPAHLDPVVMQHQADTLYRMHHALAESPSITIALIWGDLSTTGCRWNLSSNQWSSDDSHCPAPRVAVTGSFTFLPWATR